MAGTTEIFVFKDALIVLGTAAVVAPVVHRLKISPVLGFLVVGAALGPHGLGRLAEYSRAIDWFTVTGERQIAFIADLGIVFLLFFIGLELSMRRLLTMRRLVFGLGGLQVLADRAPDRPRRAVARPAARRSADHRHLPGALVDRHRHGAAVRASAA